MKKNLKTSTLCVHGGYEPKNGEPRQLPIIQSTTFKYDNSEEMAMLFDLKKEGYFYTRLQNPTNDAVAAKIAALEGGVGAMLTSSGQAANFYTVFNICQAGDHFVTSNEIYGGTFNLFAVTLKKLGIECTFVNQDASEEEIQKAFQPNTKLLFGETISNPGCKVLDIEKFAKIAHKMVCHSSLTTHLPLLSIADHLNGDATSSHILLPNIWTDMPHRWADVSSIAETSTGINIRRNIQD